VWHSRESPEQDRGIVKAFVFTATLCLGAFASAAFAADVAMRGNVTETLDASDNYFLSSHPSGVTAKSLTSGTLDILALTPTTRYLLNTNYSYYKYFGPGAADTTLTWGTPANAVFRVDHLTELDHYNFAASWTRADAAVTALQQTGTGFAHGSINTYDVNGGVTHDIGRNDTISWTADANKVQFTDPSSTPYNDVSSSLFWVHNLTPTTTMNTSANFDWFSQDNAANSQRLMWRFMTGFQSQLSPLLTVHGNFGWVFANAYQNGDAAMNANAGAPIPPVVIIPGVTPFIPGVAPFQPLVGAGNGWIGDIGFSYRLLKDTTVSGIVSSAIIPVFTGQLQQTESIAMSVNHTVNSLSNLSFFSSYSQASSPGQIGQAGAAVSDFFSAGVSYNYQLSRYWRTNVSYTFRENVGQAKSSTILFSLSRDFNVLGNPTAITQAEAERSRQRARASIGQVFPNFQ
jgi:hypothetical protein